MVYVMYKFMPSMSCESLNFTYLSSYILVVLLIYHSILHIFINLHFNCSFIMFMNINN